MKYKLVITYVAEKDIHEAALWYKNIRTNLGHEFIESIDSSIKLIQQLPESFPKVYKNIRRILLKRFPFGIFYLIDKKKIIILAVFHVSRDPRSWKTRVDS